MSWSDLDYTRLRDRLLARGVPERLVPPAEPPLADLVRESEQRTAHAQEAATGLAMLAVFERRSTDAWPDPYGPDRIVFGSEPRVQSDA